MKQIILSPAILGRTYMLIVELTDGGVVRTERRDLGKEFSIDRLVEYMRGYNLPIFVDPAYPQVRDILKKNGHWVLK